MVSTPAASTRAVGIPVDDLLWAAARQEGATPGDARQRAACHRAVSNPVGERPVDALLLAASRREGAHSADGLLWAASRQEGDLLLAASPREGAHPVDATQAGGCRSRGEMAVGSPPEDDCPVDYQFQDATEEFQSLDAMGAYLFQFQVETAEG